MRFFRRIADLWLHAILLTEGPQEPVGGLPSSERVISAGKSLQSASSLEDSSSECIHGATNRQCWSPGFNITTDYERAWPNTGKTKQYTLVLTNEWSAPDGYNVSRMLINGTYPGPLVEADWGDLLNITVINQLSNHNGTSIHWHGIRQLNTVWQDGVAGVTQCPVPPGQQVVRHVVKAIRSRDVSHSSDLSLKCNADSEIIKVYTWRATQYGVSWYHSHFSLQYADGLVGPLKINGPTSMNYDHDLGPVLITDWIHKDAFSLFQLEMLGRPATPDSNLLNGKGPYYCCPSLDEQCTGKTPFTEFNFTKGSSYKMSLVNTAISTHFTYWIDDHDFYVVATDFVPIQPYRTSTINIAIGQRYDIIIIAKNGTQAMPSPNYWIHARDCNNIGQRSGLGIIRYDASNKNFPLSAPPDRLCYGCLDEESKNLHPLVRRSVGSSSNKYGGKDSLDVYLQGYPDANDQNSVLHKWVLKDSSFYIDWTEPSLSLITINGDRMDDPFPQDYNPVFLNQNIDSWVYFLIEGQFTPDDQKIYKKQAPVAHPVHLHGHDFVILASGNHTYDPVKDKPNVDNPPRRDVALLPVNGFLLIAFQINNPGTWLMHCHIAWHASGGLALQFVERQKDIVPLMQKAGVYGQYFDTCAKWGAYYKVFNEKYNLTMDDSGV